MTTVRRLWVLTGMIAIGAGAALVVTSWVGEADLQSFSAIGFSVAAIGMAIIAATRVW